MIKSFTDILNEENEIKQRSWSLRKSVGAVLAVVLLAVITVNTTGCTQSNMADEDVIINTPAELPKENVKVGDDGVNGAIAPDDVSIVADQTAKNSSMVAMSVEDMGRSDPFLPEHENADSKPKPKYGFDLLPPPETITVDTTATDVISTKVSGIMYDRFNPSAILNISGSDYLVRTGDIINNYKVLSIGRDQVTVQNGANVYKAGVGELFTGEGINFNTVSNLESKFGGRKNSANK